MIDYGPCGENYDGNGEEWADEIFSVRCSSCDEWSNPDECDARGVCPNCLTPKEQAAKLRAAIADYYYENSEPKEAASV